MVYRRFGNDLDYDDLPSQPDVNDLLQTIDSAKKFMRGLIEAIYFSGSKEMLEDNLEELANALSMKIPMTTPVI